MLHLSALLLSSMVCLCSIFAPTAIVNTVPDTAEDIHYYDTLYGVDDELMTLEMTSVYINYITKTHSNYHSLAISCPSYTYSPAVGGCAAVAAGNVIGYYDRFDENLIPDHKAGNPLANTFVYSYEDEAACRAIDKLYEYIIGNGYGATENDFKNGITRYCTEKGKSITFSSCMKDGYFSYSSAKQYLNQNLPLVLFLEGYNVGYLHSDEGTDAISYYTSTANHIMIAFGYDSYIYTTTSGTVEYYYLSVASGVPGNSSGLYDFYMDTKINDALAVNIY